MAKAKKLPSGNWRVQAYSNGIHKSFTAPTKKEAELKAINWQSGQTRIYKTNNVTLKEAAEKYIECRQSVVSPVTIETYNGYLKRYLLDLQSKPIQNITENTLQTAFNELSSNLSPKTVKCVYAFFSAVFKQYNIEHKIILPKVYKKIYNVPDKEQSKKLLEAVKGHYIEVPVNLALRCGMRISEIRGLKFSNVKNNTITVDNVIVTIGDKTIEKSPKSSAGVRMFPIPQDISDMIDKLPHDTEYITKHSDKAINKSLHIICRKNGIQEFTVHELRHGFASAMALLGIPEHYAMAIGGWDTSDTMHKIYMQTFDKSKMEFSQKINKYFL